MEHPLESTYHNQRWVTVARYQGPPALPRWIFELSRDFLVYDGRSDEQKARETAGDAILNYEAHIVTTLMLLSRSFRVPSAGIPGAGIPSADTVKWYSAGFVSNKTLYQ